MDFARNLVTGAAGMDKEALLAILPEAVARKLAQYQESYDEAAARAMLLGP